MRATQREQALPLSTRAHRTIRRTPPPVYPKRKGRDGGRVERPELVDDGEDRRFEISNALNEVGAVQPAAKCGGCGWVGWGAKETRMRARTQRPVYSPCMACSAFEWWHWLTCMCRCR
eukprot:3713294-Prymnesium_polylepis.2